MRLGEVPGQTVGSLDASDGNATIERLPDIVASTEEPI
jgi:hypothetical protein